MLEREGEWLTLKLNSNSGVILKFCMSEKMPRCFISQGAVIAVSTLQTVLSLMVQFTSSRIWHGNEATKNWLILSLKADFGKKLMAVTRSTTI